MGAPITAARFSISVDGYEIGSFSELAGISSQVDPVDYVPSGGNDSTLLDRFGARRTQTALKLRRRRSNDPRLGAWHLAAARNRAASLKTCELRVFNALGRPVARYRLEHAWPSKIDIGSFTAGPTRSGQSETVTITCEFIQRVGV
jgi:phage tail-like protein